MIFDPAHFTVPFWSHKNSRHCLDTLLLLRNPTATLLKIINVIVIFVCLSVCLLLFVVAIVVAAAAAAASDESLLLLLFVCLFVVAVVVAAAAASETLLLLVVCLLLFLLPLLLFHFLFKRICETLVSLLRVCVMTSCRLTSTHCVNPDPASLLH